MAIFVTEFLPAMIGNKHHHNDYGKEHYPVWTAMNYSGFIQTGQETQQGKQNYHYKPDVMPRLRPVKEAEYRHASSYGKSEDCNDFGNIGRPGAHRHGPDE